MQVPHSYFVVLSGDNSILCHIFSVCVVLTLLSVSQQELDFYFLPGVP